MNSDFAKPFVMAGFAYALDKYYIGEIDMKRSAYFAVATGLGQYSSQWVSPILNPIFENIPSMSENLYDSKTLAQRISEVSASAGMVYLLNKYVFQNDQFPQEIYLRLGVIAAADFLSEYSLDFVNGRKLAFLTN